MKHNLIKLGSTIKALRKNLSLTLTELANKTGLTAGLLSRIENFRTVPSLPVLVNIANALDVPPAKLLEGIEKNPEQKWILTRKEDRQPITREDNLGFNYVSLLDTSSSNLNLQTMLLTVSPGAQREKVTTQGDELIYILEGEIDFILEDETIKMQNGDLLFFDGRIPHVPQNNRETPAVLLAVYLIKPDDS